MFVKLHQFSFNKVSFMVSLHWCLRRCKDRGMKQGLKEKLLAKQKKYTHQVVACPSCSQKLRIPLRFGKTLSINCSRCRSNFQVKIPHPIKEMKRIFSDIFSWDFNSNFSQNIQSSTRKFFFILRYTPVGRRFFKMMLYVLSIFFVLKLIK